MQLSTEQESDYLARFKPALMAFARKFCAKFAGYGRLDADDCFQELCIVFLAHLRSVDSEENVFPLPYRDFHHALCVSVLSSMPCSVPKRTTKFRNVFREYGWSDSLDELLENGLDLSGGVAKEYSEVDEKLSFDKFMSELTQDERDALNAMARTGSMTEAGRMLGVHRSTVCRRLAGLRSKYLNSCAR